MRLSPQAFKEMKYFFQYLHLKKSTWKYQYDRGCIMINDEKKKEAFLCKLKKSVGGKGKQLGKLFLMQSTWNCGARREAGLVITTYCRSGNSGWLQNDEHTHLREVSRE